MFAPSCPRDFSSHCLSELRLLAISFHIPLFKVLLEAPDPEVREDKAPSYSYG